MLSAAFVREANVLIAVMAEFRPAAVDLDQTE